MKRFQLDVNNIEQLSKGKYSSQFNYRKNNDLKEINLLGKRLFELINACLEANNYKSASKKVV